MLHALRIAFGGRGRDSERSEEGHHDLVTVSTCPSQQEAFLTQADGSVGRTGHQSCFCESIQDPGDGDVTHLHAGRKVLHPAHPMFDFDVLDRLDVVLSGLVGMISAGLGEWIGSAVHVVFFRLTHQPPHCILSYTV